MAFLQTVQTDIKRCGKPRQQILGNAAAIVLNQVQIAGRNPDLSRQIGLPQPQGLPAFTQTASGQGGQGHGISLGL